MITLQVDSGPIVPFPNSWNDLSKRQMVYISKILFQPGVISHHKKVAAFLILMFYQLGWNVARKENRKILSFFFQFLRMSVFTVNKIIEGTDFIWKENGLRKFVIQDFRHRGRLYLAPDTLLANLTIGEFAYADTFYVRFKKHYRMEDLDQLVATIYRTKDPRSDESSENYKGDARIPFNEHNIPYWTKRLEKLKPAMKYAIMLQYEGNRNGLIEIFKDLFTQSDEKAVKSEGWGKVMMMMATSVDKFQDVKNVNLYEFFNRLTMDMKRNEALNKKANEKF